MVGWKDEGGKVEKKIVDYENLSEKMLTFLILWIFVGLKIGFYLFLLRFSNVFLSVSPGFI